LTSQQDYKTKELDKPIAISKRQELESQVEIVLYSYRRIWNDEMIE
jgi:hypothetical protein